MVLAYLGQTVSRDWLCQVLKVTGIGTPGFRLLCLRDHGYDVTYAPATDERPLIEALSAGVLPITLLLTHNLSYWQKQTAHAVVVAGFDAQTVILNDPAFPDTPRQVPYDEFMLAWSDFDYLYAVIRLLD
jgi:hypothetical protein